MYTYYLSSGNTVITLCLSVCRARNRSSLAGASPSPPSAAPPTHPTRWHPVPHPCADNRTCGYAPWPLPLVTQLLHSGTTPSLEHQQPTRTAEPLPHRGIPLLSPPLTTIVWIHRAVLLLQPPLMCNTPSLQTPPPICCRQSSPSPTLAGTTY